MLPHSYQHYLRAEHEPDAFLLCLRHWDIWLIAQTTAADILMQQHIGGTGAPQRSHMLKRRRERTEPCGIHMWGPLGKKNSCLSWLSVVTQKGMSVAICTPGTEGVIWGSAAPHDPLHLWTADRSITDCCPLSFPVKRLFWSDPQSGLNA